jgi:hypothetical protein
MRQWKRLILVTNIKSNIKDTLLQSECKITPAHTHCVKILSTPVKVRRASSFYIYHLAAPSHIVREARQAQLTIGAMFSDVHPK